MTSAIDHEHLEKYVCGDDGLRAEVLTIFETQVKRLREAVNPAADDNVWRDLMHSMKGASRGVGAWTVGRLCERGEALIGERPEKVDLRKALLIALSRALDDAVADAAQMKAASCAA